MQTSELKKKGINAVFWNLSGTLMKQGISFVISIFLARLLSPADFGLVGMATVFIALTQSFTDFGMTSALIQKKEPTATQYNTVFYINLGLSVVLMLLMIACSGYIADYYNNPEVGRIARFVSYSFVINAINGVQNAQLTKALANKVKTLASLSSSIVSGVVGISLAFMGLGVWALIYGTLAGSLVSTAVIWYKSKWRPQLMFSFPEVKPLLGYGSKMFVSGLLDTAYSKLDILIIGKIFSPATLGYYYRAISFNQLITKYTSASLNGVFFPVIAHLQDKPQEQLRVITRALHVMSFLTFALMGLLYLDAKVLIVILFSDKWLVSVGYFQILVFYAYVYPVSVILVNVLSGNGKSGMFLQLEVWKKVTGLTALAIGFYIGMEGFLWSKAVASTVALFLNFWYVQRTIGWAVWRQAAIVYRYAIVAIATVLPNIWLQSLLPDHHLLQLIIISITFTASYVSVSAVLRLAGYEAAKKLVVDIIKGKLKKR